MERRGHAEPGVAWKSDSSPAATMPAVRIPPIASPASTTATRLLIHAGFLACGIGFVVHRMWAVLPAARLGETLLLAVLAAVAAWLLARAGFRFANALVAVWMLAAIAMGGLLPALGALTLALACVAIGSAIDRHGGLVRAGVVGAGIIAGVIGWLLPLPLHRAGFYVALAAITLWLRRRKLGSLLQAAWGDWQRAVDEAPRIAGWSLLALGLASAGAWLPTMQYDDLAYHLGLPWQLMENGRYALDASRQVWALAPWSGDVLQAIAQVIARQEARGPLDALWLVGAAALAWQLARALGATVPQAWLTLLLLATLPMMAALAGGMQTELPAAVAMLGLALLVAGERPGRAEVFAAAVLAGLLLGLKPLHILAALGLVVAMIWKARQAFTRRPVDMLLAVLVMAAVGGSSYAYAAQACGNPVLPLFNATFLSPCYPPHDFADTRWQWQAGAFAPWAMTFQTRHYLEGWDGGIGFVLVALSGAALAALLHRRTALLSLCAIIAIVIPLLVVPYARYLVPGMVLLLPPAVVAVTSGLAARPAWVLLLSLGAANLAFQANSNWLLHTGGVKRALTSGGRDGPLLARYVPERVLIDRLRHRDPRISALDLDAATHAELAGRGWTTGWYAPRVHAAAMAAGTDPSGQAWAGLIGSLGVDGVILRPASLTAAQRAGLQRLGAYPALTVGTVEWWALPEPHRP